MCIKCLPAVKRMTSRLPAESGKMAMSLASLDPSDSEETLQEYVKQKNSAM